MRFSSEEERLAHPQAGLLSSWAWNKQSYFNQELSDYQLRLMENPSEEVDRILNLDEASLFNELPNKSEKVTAWLALAYAMPPVHHAVFLAFAYKIELLDEEIFILVTDVGDANHLQYWSQCMAQTHEGKAELQRIISSKGDYAFCVAAYFGSVAMIKALLDIEGVDVGTYVEAAQKVVADKLKLPANNLE